MIDNALEPLSRLHVSSHTAKRSQRTLFTSGIHESDTTFRMWKSRRNLIHSPNSPSIVFCGVLAEADTTYFVRLRCPPIFPPEAVRGYASPATVGLSMLLLAFLRGSSSRSATTLILLSALFSYQPSFPNLIILVSKKEKIMHLPLEVSWLKQSTTVQR